MPREPGSWQTPTNTMSALLIMAIVWAAVCFGKRLLCPGPTGGWKGLTAGLLPPGSSPGPAASSAATSLPARPSCSRQIRAPSCPACIHRGPSSCQCPPGVTRAPQLGPAPADAWAAWSRCTPARTFPGRPARRRRGRRSGLGGTRLQRRWHPSICCFPCPKRGATKLERSKTTFRCRRQSPVG